MDLQGSSLIDEIALEKVCSDSCQPSLIETPRSSPYVLVAQGQSMVERNRILAITFPITFSWSVLVLNSGENFFGGDIICITKIWSGPPMILDVYGCISMKLGITLIWRLPVMLPTSWKSRVQIQVDVCLINEGRAR